MGRIFGEDSVIRPGSRRKTIGAWAVSAWASVRQGALGQSAGTFVLRALGTGSAFCVAVLLARYLGDSGYGLYVYATSWVNVLVIPASMGIGELAVREISRYLSGNDLARAKGLTRWGHIFAALSSVGVAGLTVAVLQVTGTWDTASGKAVAVAVIALPFLAMARVRSGVLRGAGKVIAGQAPDQFLRGAVMLAFVATALTLGALRSSPLLFIAGWILAAAIAWIIGAMILNRSLPGELWKSRVAVHGRYWARSSFPFLLISGVLVLNARTDVVMVGAISGPADAGVYSVATRIAELIAFVLAAANTALAPIFARHHANRAQNDLEKLLKVSTRLIAAFSVAAGLILVALAHPVLAIFGPEFGRGAAALSILAVGRVVDGASGSVGQVLNMTNHQGDTAFAIGASAALNVGLNAVLIPACGLVGAATATATSTVAYNVLLAACVYRRIGYYPLLGVVDIRRTR